MSALNLEANANIISIGLISISFLVIMVFIYYTKKNRTSRTDNKEILAQIEQERNNATQMNLRLMRALSKDTREVMMEECSKGFIKSIQKMAEKNGIAGTSIHLDQSIYSDSEKMHMGNTSYNTKGSNTKNEKNKESSKIAECDKSDFNFSSINLLLGYLSKNGNWIYNPNLQEKIFLLSKQDFFVKFQNFLNNLVKTKLYEINDSSLRQIKGAIWSGDVKKVIEVINIVNQLDIFESEYDAARITGDRVFSKILVSVLDSDCYQVFKKEDKEIKGAKDNLYRNLNTKKSQKKKGETVVFTTEDMKLEENIRQDIAVIKEIEKIVGKGFVEFIGLDIDERILKLKIESFNIFSKEIKTLIEYYKRNANLTKIIFYL